MDGDTNIILRVVAVSGHVTVLLHNQNPASGFGEMPRGNASGKSCAYDQNVYCHV
jgi:hypothetical protein